jgi:hypothetical protein
LLTCDLWEEVPLTVDGEGNARMTRSSRDLHWIDSGSRKKRDTSVFEIVRA